MNSIQKSLTTHGRSLAWLAGAIFLIAMTLAPTDVTAQVSTCYGCFKSYFQPTHPSSQMCAGSSSGRSKCASAGTPEFHLCLPYGTRCGSGVSGAADDLAVASARAGLTPSIDSDYLVVAEAGDIVVMRRCGAEVARFAMSERGAESRAGLVAMDPTDGLEHPEVPIMAAASDPRQRISEQ